LSKVKSEWEQLIADYNRDNRRIRRDKRHWLTPEETKMKKRPVEMESEAEEAAESSEEGEAVLPKKRTKKNKYESEDSPVKQVMKAVTKAVTKLPPGPSKSNLKGSQSKGRVDKSDGPSAEKKGKA
jgi:hypothetical protein